MATNPRGVGIVGSGALGAPLARRLSLCGHKVTVYARGRSTGSDVGAAKRTTDIADLVNSAVVLVVVPTLEAVRDVLAHIAQWPTSPTVVQMSTVAPGDLLALARQFKLEDRLVDAPVVGSGHDALRGELRVLIAGPQGAVRCAREVLDDLGVVRNTGQLGAASALKLVVNYAVAPSMLLLAGALALGDTLGLAPELMVDELLHSRARDLVSRKRDMILSGESSVSAPLETFAKDMRLLLRLSEQAGLECSMLVSALKVAEQALSEGFAGRDYSSLIPFVRSAAQTTPPSAVLPQSRHPGYSR